METGHKDYVKFLGTAGARFVVAKQLRSSAGVYVNIKDARIIIDPGPGTLVRCAKSKPPIDVTKLDAVILTHAHIDHSNDANILVDAMTGGGLSKKGLLFAPEDCIYGENAVVLPYVREFLEDIVILSSRGRYSVGGVSFTTSLRHQHPVETYGIIFDYYGRRISFMVDTHYVPELIRDYEDSDILVLNVVRSTPHESSKVMHLSIDDVREILTRIRPRKAVLTHFGMTMLRAKPWVVAEELSRELRVDVIAASDGMTLELERGCGSVDDG
jgi:phosphoribosyl 1,2-cyclic phosphodiesterase